MITYTYVHIKPGLGNRPYLHMDYNNIINFRRNITLSVASNA